MQSKITCKSRKEERGYCVKPLHYVLQCILKDDIQKLRKCSLDEIPKEFEPGQVDCDLHRWIFIPLYDMILYPVDSYQRNRINVANIITFAFMEGSLSCFRYLLQRNNIQPDLLDVFFCAKQCVDGGSSARFKHLLQHMDSNILSQNLFYVFKNFGTLAAFFLGETYFCNLSTCSEIVNILKLLFITYDVEIPTSIDGFYHTSGMAYFVRVNKNVDEELFSVIIQKATVFGQNAECLNIEYEGKIPLLHSVNSNHVDYEKAKILLPLTNLNKTFVFSYHASEMTIKDYILGLEFGEECMKVKNCIPQYELLMTDINKLNVNMLNVNDRKIGGSFVKYSVQGIKAPSKNQPLDLKSISFYFIRNYLPEGLHFKQSINMLPIPTLLKSQIFQTSQIKYKWTSAQ